MSVTRCCARPRRAIPSPGEQRAVPSTGHRLGSAGAWRVVPGAATRSGLNRGGWRHECVPCGVQKGPAEQLPGAPDPEQGELVGEAGAADVLRLGGQGAVVAVDDELRVAIMRVVRIARRVGQVAQGPGVAVGRLDPIRSEVGPAHVVAYAHDGVEHLHAVGGIHVPGRPLGIGASWARSSRSTLKHAYIADSLYWISVTYC